MKSYLIGVRIKFLVQLIIAVIAVHQGLTRPPIVYSNYRSEIMEVYQAFGTAAFALLAVEFLWRAVCPAKPNN